MASKINFNQLLNHEDVDLIFTLEEEIAAGSFGTVYIVLLSIQTS